jgi:gluconokinase
MKSLGKLASLEEGVHQYVRFTDTYHPDPSQTKVYQKAQREFVKAMAVR